MTTNKGLPNFYWLPRFGGLGGALNAVRKKLDIRYAYDIMCFVLLVS